MGESHNFVVWKFHCITVKKFYFYKLLPLQFYEYFENILFMFDVPTHQWHKHNFYMVIGGGGLIANKLSWKEHF